MIRANELRRGNLAKPLKPRHEEKYLTVESISNTAINIEFREYLFEDIDPIPLTPEILEKAGFERMQLATYKRWCKYHPTFYLQLSKGYYYVVGYKHYPNGINYLHQLQNLYFALTGEELNIEL